MAQTLVLMAQFGVALFSCKLYMCRQLSDNIKLVVASFIQRSCIIKGISPGTFSLMQHIYICIFSSEEARSNSGFRTSVDTIIVSASHFTYTSKLSIIFLNRGHFIRGARLQYGRRKHSIRVGL